MQCKERTMMHVVNSENMVAYMVLVLWVIIPSTNIGMFSVASQFQYPVDRLCLFVDSHVNTASTKHRGTSLLYLLHPTLQNQRSQDAACLL